MPQSKNEARALHYPRLCAEAPATQTRSHTIHRSRATMRTRSRRRRPLLSGKHWAVHWKTCHLASQCTNKTRYRHQRTINWARINRLHHRINNQRKHAEGSIMRACLWTFCRISYLRCNQGLGWQVHTSSRTWRRKGEGEEMAIQRVGKDRITWIMSCKIYTLNRDIPPPLPNSITNTKISTKSIKMPSNNSQPTTGLVPPCPPSATSGKLQAFTISLVARRIIKIILIMTMLAIMVIKWQRVGPWRKTRVIRDSFRYWTILSNMRWSLLWQRDNSTTGSIKPVSTLLRHPNHLFPRYWEGRTKMWIRLWKQGRLQDLIISATIRRQDPRLRKNRADRCVNRIQLQSPLPRTIKQGPESPRWSPSPTKTTHADLKRCSNDWRKQRLTMGLRVAAQPQTSALAVLQPVEQAAHPSQRIEVRSHRLGIAISQGTRLRQWLAKYLKTLSAQAAIIAIASRPDSSRRKASSKTPSIETNREYEREGVYPSFQEEMKCENYLILGWQICLMIFRHA